MNSLQKITIISLCCFGLPSAEVAAQWSNMSSGITDGITSICSPSPDTAYAVSTAFANGGKIIATKNGTNWNQQFSSPKYLLTVFFRSANLGWAGGGIIPGGIILKTTDGGNKWDTMTTSLFQIYSIHFINDTLGWAIGNDATQGSCYIYHSTDGGLNWSQQFSGFDYLRNIHFTSPLIGYAAGDNGRIFKTIDGGLNWLLLSTGVVFHFSDVEFVSDSIGWAVGSYVTGGCYHTTDGGASWNAQNLPFSTPLRSVSFVSPNTGWICGENGKVLMTTNAGTNWTAQNVPITNNLNSIHLSDPGNGYAAGETGSIIKYENSTSAIHETTLNAIQAFPIPTSGELFISAPENFLNNYFSISDCSGRIVFKGQLTSNNNRIDISLLANGIYFLKSDMQTNARLKIIKN